MSQILSPTSAIASEVDSIAKAVRTSIRPIISSTLGSYACSLQSGVMAAGLAANSEVWQARYGGTNLAVVDKVIIDGIGSVVAFTAGVAQFRLFVSRSYTANGSGGTAATLTGNNCKLRTSHATTAMADIRIASTSALTSPSGDIPDAQAMGAVLNGFAATAGAGILEGTLWDSYGVIHPIVLAQNEGLILQATVPATGTWTFGVSFRWHECTAAEWN